MAQSSNSQQQSSKTSKIVDVRKKIARALTVINQKAKADLRAKYADAKHKPLDLRPKLTRALRRALTFGETHTMATTFPKGAKPKKMVKRVTEREAKRQAVLKGLRKPFAVKAE